MRWTARSWLWGVLVVLLFGLVFMHHMPSHGGHEAGSAATSTALTEIDGPVMAMTERPGADCPCPAAAPDVPHPAGGGGPVEPSALLHLCLAVLAALGGVLAAGLLLRGIISGAGRNVGSAGWRIPLECRRPPVPVPRCLAALCVLRL